MSYSVLQCKVDLSAVLHGTTLNQIENINGLLLRGARQLILEIDPQETKRIQEFVNPIYNSVYDYAVPDDLKGNRIIDIRPQVNRNRNELLTQNYNQQFDLFKRNNTSNFTINFNKGIKTIRINAPFLNSGTTIDECNDSSIWTASGTASNVAENNVRYVSESTSIQFDLATGGAGSIGYLTGAITAVDLTDLLNQGALFLYTYLPTGSNFNSVTLRWGSDASNYWEVAVTTTQTGSAFQNGQNLLAFNWLGATKTGSPDVTAVDYIRIAWNYNGTAQTAVGLDNIVARLGKILECEYYSKFMFSDASTGVWQEAITDDSNLINLDSESYNLYFNLITYFALQQQQGVDAMKFDAQYFLKLYTEGVARYKALYKSEVQKPQSTYYKRPTRGFGNWMTTWYNR